MLKFTEEQRIAKLEELIMLKKYHSSEDITDYESYTKYLERRYNYVLNIHDKKYAPNYISKLDLSTLYNS
jgi:hypothetical protein